MKQLRSESYLKLSSALLVVTSISLIGILLLRPSDAAITYDPKVYAEQHLTGYLWGDSAGGTKDSWKTSNGSQEVRDRFYTVAMELKRTKFPNATVTKSSTSVTISGMMLSIPLDRLPTIIQNDLTSSNKNGLIAFSTSVIEGEGSQGGLLIDDPDVNHRNAFVSVMTALGVKTQKSVSKPNQGVDAAKESWPIIQCWPFATYKRVPGGAPAPGTCSTSNQGDTTAPTVTMNASPLNLAAGGTVTMNASASDNVGVTKVEFLVDGAVKSTATSTPYAYTWNTTGISAGTHTLRAKAYDAAGNTAVSAAVNVTVTTNTSDSTPPAVTLTAPAAGSTITGASASLAATATDNAGIANVAFSYKPTTATAWAAAGTSDSTSPYSAAWDTSSLMNGTYNLRATATDTSGNTATSGVTTVTLNKSTTGCTTTHAPGAFGTITTQTNIPSGTYKVWSRIQIPDATNNGYDLVVKDACTFNKTITTASVGSWVWVAANTNVTLDGGATPVMMYGTKTGVALDKVLLTTDTACVPTGTGGNCSGSVIDPDLTTPTANVTVTPTVVNTGGLVTLNGTANDNIGVTKIEFYVDGSLKSTANGAGPATYSWNTAGVSAGAHTVTTKAYDAAGNVGTSASVTVTVTNNPVMRGDVNGDGRVNALDLSVVITRDNQNYPPADFDGDGTVGASDIAILLGNWTW